MSDLTSERENLQPESVETTGQHDKNKLVSESSNLDISSDDPHRETPILSPASDGLTASWFMPLSPSSAPTPATSSAFNKQVQPVPDTWVDAEYQGIKFGSYHRVISAGHWRFGELFHAEHLKLQRRVLLIVLSPEWSAQPEIKSWFVETVKLIGGIQDSHLSAALLEYGTDDDGTFIATPLPGDSAREFYCKLPFQAYFPKTYDPTSEAFTALLCGLRALHQVGISHGSIQSDHFFLANSAEAVRFMPFAVGVPQAAWIDSRKKIVVQPPNAFVADYQTLALEFIRLLLGDRSLAMPAKPTRHWFRQSLPFVSPKLGKLLVKISQKGLQPQEIDTILKKLDSVRYEILVPVTWSTRIYHLISEIGLAIICYFLVSVFVNVLFSIGDLWRGIVSADFLKNFIFLAIYLLWEPIFNTTLARYFLQCQLIDIKEQRPTVYRRILRSCSRLGVWLACFVPISALMFGTGPIDEVWYALLSIVLSFSVPICVVYATALLFGGQPFHEWISGTRWIQFRTMRDGYSLSNNASQPYARTLFHDKTLETTDASSLGAIEDIKVRRKLGQGGMGTVYLGYDQGLEREVAIKVTLADECESNEAFARFRREAKLAAKIDHPNITKVYRVGMWKNQPFMEMEYVDGETFQQVVHRDGPVSMQTAWNWILQAANGLREASDHGVIHRDIKPSNLMISKEGLVKVMDFGISKTIADDWGTAAPMTSELRESQSLIEPSPSEVPDTSKEETTLLNVQQAFKAATKRDLVNSTFVTQMGSMLGTPQYMSPEQILCRPVDCRSDIYSLGLTLYYLLAGRPPFELSGTKGVPGLLMRQCSEYPPPLPDHLLGEKQRKVLERMIAKEPGDRFQDYQQLIESLQATLIAVDRVPGRQRRSDAYIVDLLVLSTLYVVVFGIHLGSSTLWAWMTLCVVYLVAIPLFFGGNLSHKFFRLVVQTKYGDTPHWLRVFIRQFVKYLPYFLVVFWARSSLDFELGGKPFAIERQILLPLLATLVLYPLYGVISYIVLVHWNRDRRAIHDFLAGTRVVYRPSAEDFIVGPRSSIRSFDA